MAVNIPQNAIIQAGGSDCAPSKINLVPARERQAKADACAEAEEQHREAADNLIESRRAAQAAEAGAVASAAQARIEAWSSAIGLLTLLAAVAAAWFAKKAANHTESGAKEAKRSADLALTAQRPWVDLEITEISMSSSKEEFTPDISLELKNLGDTPALNVQCRARIITNNGRVANYGDFYPPADQNVVRINNILPRGRAFDRVLPRMAAVQLNVMHISVDKQAFHAIGFFPALEVEVRYQWGNEPTEAITRKHFAISAVPEDGAIRDRVSYPITLGTMPVTQLTTFETGIAEVT
jgi:hypothetical protein